ncbi:hypothetical protein CDD83_6229 [Cordyceps sp. RAO-2017]|nr:hypothetical protein CDD83_6229 [Cordyceps sp. RAO-2017]
MAAPLRNAVRSSRALSTTTSASIRRPRRLTTACGPADADAKSTPHQTPDPAPPRSPAQRPALARPRFDGTPARRVGRKGEQSPDPNKARLGKTLRILQERLPTLLQSPLPQDILAPNISLQLFPSTHPHLPTVSGRVAYNAALWTSPIAWNRVPIIGNVKLEILAERMTSEPLAFVPRRAGAIPEQLVVRWCEKRRSAPAADDDGDPGPSSIARTLWRGRGVGVDPNKAFSGLFIFDFDADGRVLTHTIEQAQEGGSWERGMGAKFVGLTDWLLGGMRNPGDTPLPAFENLKKRRQE